MPESPQWSQSYSVGHPVLDGQHRWLFSLCARATDCASHPAGAGPQEVEFADLLNDLMAYSLRHMAYEEALLRECGYPELDRHGAAHHDFIARLTGYTCASMDNPLDKQEIARFVWAWWSDHVLVQDMHFRDWITRYYGY